MKIKLLTVCLVSLIVLAGCSTMPKAPTINGKPVFIKVVIEDNIQKDMDTAEVQRYSQVAAYMADNLLKDLQRSGYQAELIAKKSNFKSGERALLLDVKIKRYNFRAVGTFLETGYVLSGEKELLSSSHGCSTARNWRHCVIKLNKDMVEAITLKMRAMEAVK